MRVLKPLVFMAILYQRCFYMTNRRCIPIAEARGISGEGFDNIIHHNQEVFVMILRSHNKS